MKLSGRQRRWVYALPCLHLFACAVIGLGYLVRPWQSLLLGMEYLIIADFPVSFLGVGLAWSHQVFALTWFVVAGTLWWYVLGRIAAFVVAQMKSPATNADTGH